MYLRFLFAPALFPPPEKPSLFFARFFSWRNTPPFWRFQTLPPPEHPLFGELMVCPVLLGRSRFSEQVYKTFIGEAPEGWSPLRGFLSPSLYYSTPLFRMGTRFPVKTCRRIILFLAPSRILLDHVLVLRGATVNRPERTSPFKKWALSARGAPGFEQRSRLFFGPGVSFPFCALTPFYRKKPAFFWPRLTPFLGRANVPDMAWLNHSLKGGSPTLSEGPGLVHVCWRCKL